MAGALFGIEALFAGSLTYQVLFPSVVAALTGYLTASFLGMPAMNFVASSFSALDPTLLMLTLWEG